MARESAKPPYVVGTIPQISQEMSPDAMWNATLTLSLRQVRIRKKEETGKERFLVLNATYI